jgi:hypothetical protein
MPNVMSGPMFEPAEDEHRKSIYDKRGGHYNIFASRNPDAALAMLRQWFPKGTEASEFNLVFFSTSGVHGMYTTIEEVEADIRKYGPTPPEPKDEDDEDYHPREVTFLLVQPRIVGTTYGNCACRTLDDVRYLKRLRAASWKAASRIGAPPKMKRRK